MKSQKESKWNHKLLDWMKSCRPLSLCPLLRRVGDSWVLLRQSCFFKVIHLVRGRGRQVAWTLPLFTFLSTRTSSFYITWDLCSLCNAGEIGFSFPCCQELYAQKDEVGNINIYLSITCLILNWGCALQTEVCTENLEILLPSGPLSTRSDGHCWIITCFWAITSAWMKGV